MTLTAAPDTRPAPVEPTTPIKPSEAIRLGCLIAPVQAFGTSGVRGVSACVIAALMRGGPNTPIPPVFGTACPACDDKCTSILHLNDDHRWTREAIADWLEGLGL